MICSRLSARYIAIEKRQAKGGFVSFLENLIQIILQCNIEQMARVFKRWSHV
jgi:hypothetical protein